MLIFGPVVDFYLTANPFDRSLRSASCVVSLCDLRLLSSIDFTVSGSYTMPSYQSLAREARRVEARLAELDYAASAVLEMLERQGVDLGYPVEHLLRRIGSIMQLSALSQPLYQGAADA